MSTDIVLYEKDGHIATVALNQPSTLNALTYELVDELHQALDRAQKGHAGGAYLISGATGFGKTRLLQLSESWAHALVWLQLILGAVES